MMKTRLVMAAAILIVVVGCGGNTTVSAKTYYVSVSGDDSADGLAEKTAWQTVAHAAKVAAAGDTVKIKAGKYDDEQVVVANSGTKDKPIVFEGYGGAPVLDGKKRAGRGILVGGREHVVVRNLKLINYMIGIRIIKSRHIVMDKIVCHKMGRGNSGVGFSISGRSQNCTLSNCQTRSCAMHGLNIMAYSHHNLIDGCTFYITTGEKLSSDYGIYTENAHHNTIRNSTIKNLNPEVKGHCGHGIALRISSHHNKAIDCKCYNLLEAFVAGEDSHDNEFINCEAYDTAEVWKRTKHSDGLVARMGAYDNKFINCLSVGCSQGISIWTLEPNPVAKYVTENVQRRNLFRNCVIVDAPQYGAVLHRAADTRIENCVFTKCKCLFTARVTFFGPADYVAKMVPTNLIKNCIFTENKEFISDREMPVVTYSCFWKNSFGARPGEGNISKNPLFAASAKGNYHLKSKAGRWDPKTKDFVKDTVDSPCIDAGDPKTEWKNEPKPNGGRVNIGAYGNTPKASKSKSSASVIVGAPTTKPTTRPAGK